jgi:ribonuclease Z
MRPEPLPERPFPGTLHAERLFALHAEVLDHGIPVLGAAIAETEHIAVNGDRLRAMGLVPGPWLRELKLAVRRCEAGQGVVAATTGAGGTRTYPRAELAAAILLRTPGQKIAYLTDLLYSADNVERAVRLARDADLLVCEAAFLDADAGLAAERGHLTARQAGEIARAAGAKRLAPFHLSPRYAGREAEVFDEAAAAFEGPVLRLGTPVP